MLGQVPGMDKAISSAAESGWLAVFVVVLVLVIVSSFAYVIKRLLDDGREREQRLGGRLDLLEDRGQVCLADLIKASTEAMTQSIAASKEMGLAAKQMTESLDRYSAILNTQPCLLRFASPEKLAELIESMRK